MMDAQRYLRGAGTFRAPGLVLLLPLIAVVSAAIVLMLLLIFIVWLVIVGVLMTAIVATDVVHRSMRRLARPPAGRLAPRAVGYPGR